MRTVVWLAEGTWQACADAAAATVPAEATITLLHVIDPEVAGTLRDARAGLLGRAGHRDDADIALTAAQAEAEQALLASAERRLGRPSVRETRRGRAEREVLAACLDADLLIMARDGDRSRPGPRSLGHASRFVLDHAPCPVLLVWPDGPAEVAWQPPSGPPPPPPPGHPAPPPPPGHAPPPLP